MAAKHSATRHKLKSRKLKTVYEDQLARARVAALTVSQRRPAPHFIIWPCQGISGVITVHV